MGGKINLIKHRYVVILALGLFISNPQVSANELKGHASPYLAMHGDDPVNWHEWNAQTVEIARQQNKLLFVSSGYFSCHWCHVMQRESYQNKDIAALLNQHFIPVKVDRELDSALDAHLIEFVERTQGISGWPLNTFVTPEGYPLVGMVYVPPDNFKQILQKLHTQWRNDAAALRQLARNASQELSGATTTQNSQLPPGLGQSLMQDYVLQTMSNADTLQGGFGQENKFPSVPQLHTLLEIYQISPSQQVKEFLLLTLRQMATQGMRDQLTGGFYRYVVDPGWQIPHFEKMLYDNALLASLYYRAGEIFADKTFTAIGNDTLDFVLAELATGSGAYAASLSAVDNHGIEGGYYLWDLAQLKNLLSSDELAVASLYWQLSGAPDLEDGHHLVEAASLTAVAKQLKLSPQQVATRLASATQKMRKARSERVLPKDSKILTAWNGLLLSALVQGAQASGQASYRQKAVELAGFIRTRLWDQPQQLLRKAATEQGAFGPGALQDYAYVAQGLYAFWVWNQDPATKTLLTQVLEQAWRRFYGEQGWQLAQDMLLKYGNNMTLISDGPMPAASAVLIRTSYLFGTRAHEPQLVEQALRAMNVGHDEIRKDAFWFATQIDAIRIATGK